jgi:glycosyltransferase involved in cell wall biosynthesis
MKICLVNTLYHPYQVGGAERSVQILAESLAQRGHEAVVVTLGKESEQMTHNGVKIYRLALQNTYWPFDNQERSFLEKVGWHTRDIHNTKMARAIGDIFDAEKPDAIHTNNVAGFSVAAWGEARKRNIRLVHTLRDYYLLCYRTTMYKNDRNCEGQCGDCGAISFLKKIQPAQPDCIVGISDFILRRHRDNGFFVQAEHAVIFNAYDVPATRPPREPRTNFTFGYIGRLAESKGLEMLIAAFRQLADQRPDVRLMIAGKGDPTYVDSLKRLADGAPISFIGHADVATFFSSIDVTVVPSLWHEPLGRVVIESYAFGVPVIAASTGALPEIVEPDRTGYLYQTPAELTAAMERCTQLANSAYASISERCIDKARSSFSSAQVTDRYLELYATTEPTFS